MHLEVHLEMVLADWRLDSIYVSLSCYSLHEGVVIHLFSLQPLAYAQL